jgi:hypothetical protein
MLILMPYYRIKNFIISMGKTERNIFENDVRRFVEMNKFFNHDYELPAKPPVSIHSN